jgi:hypothetical protein
MRLDNRGEVLRRFFTGLTEYAFHARLGVADPPLVDYVAELLVRFVRSDAIYPLRSVRGQRLVAVADLLAEAQHREGTARQQVHRHIGDFTLFWTGVYPEVAEGMRRGGKDALIDYQQQGKRAYWIASTIPVEEKEETPPADVLKRLSEQFELCVYGLGEVRRQWEQQAGDSDAPLLLG